MHFSTWGLPYKAACQLIDDLSQEGIQANITAGGIAMHPEPGQIDAMHRICKEFNAQPVVGNTLHQELVMNPERTRKWIDDMARKQHGSGIDY